MWWWGGGGGTAGPGRALPRITCWRGAGMLRLQRQFHSPPSWEQPLIGGVWINPIVSASIVWHGLVALLLPPTPPQILSSIHPAHVAENIDRPSWTPSTRSHVLHIAMMTSSTPRCEDKAASVEWRFAFQCTASVNAFLSYLPP